MSSVIIDKRIKKYKPDIFSVGGNIVPSSLIIVRL